MCMYVCVCKCTFSGFLEPNIQGTREEEVSVGLGKRTSKDSRRESKKPRRERSNLIKKKVEKKLKRIKTGMIFFSRRDMNEI